MDEIRQTAHSGYGCESRAVFTPKYRRKEILGKIICKRCEYKKIETWKENVCRERIHMLNIHTAQSVVYRK